MARRIQPMPNDCAGAQVHRWPHRYQSRSFDFLIKQPPRDRGALVGSKIDLSVSRLVRLPATDTLRHRLSTVASFRRVARVRARFAITRLAANRDHLPGMRPGHRARAWLCIARSNSLCPEAREGATETPGHSPLKRNRF